MSVPKIKIQKLAEAWWKLCGMKTVGGALQYQDKTHTRKMK